MRFLKRTLQWTLGIICGLYLSLQIAMYVPTVQSWAGKTVASVIRNTLNWDISIGRIKLGLWNRIIIDDINLKDLQDSTLLHASRLAAKIELLPLSEGRISIANAQLFGTQIHAYQRTPDEKPNFQFIIDTFSSNDTTSKPINLHIGSILLRRVNVRWNQQWKEAKEPGVFDPAHLHFNNISLTAHLKTLTPDSLNFNLKRFSFTEKSGLTLKKATFSIEAGKDGAHLNNFSIELPNTAISIPSFISAWSYLPTPKNITDWLYDISWNTEASIHFTPSDISVFVPKLEHAHYPISTNIKAFGSEGCINVPQLVVTNDESLQLRARVFVLDFPKNPNITLNLDQLQTNSNLQQYITKTLTGTEREVSPILTRLDTVKISGRLQYSKHTQTANLHINNHVGNIHIKANAKDCNEFQSTILSSGIELNKLLSDNNIHPLGKVSLDADLNGLLKDKNGQPKINLNAIIPLFSVKDREYTGVKILANLHNNTVSLESDLEDESGRLQSKFSWVRGKKNHLIGNINIDRILSESLHLQHRYPDTRFSLNANIDVTCSNIDDIVASLNIDDITLESSDCDSVILNPWSLTLNTDIDHTKFRTVNIESTPLNLSAQGRFNFSTTATTLQNTLHEKLPNLVPYKYSRSKADTLEFDISVKDTAIIRHIALSNISIPQATTLKGKLYGYDSICVYGNIPNLHIGKEHLRNSKLDIKGTPKHLNLNLTTERKQKSGYVSMSTKVAAGENRVRIIAGLDNRRTPAFRGQLDVTTNFMKSPDGEKEIKAWIAPTELIISDTIWHIHPASVHWKNNSTSILGFTISQSEERGLDINGRLSADVNDSLTVNLKNINIEYILDLVNFKSVEFSGLATGTAIATGILSNPQAKAILQVNNFRFNQAPQGTLKANAKWGEEPNFLALDATISDPENQHHTIIKGGFNIGSKEIEDGLDLKINTKGFNLAFMNFFTKDILENFQGRASGYCRIYGPFKGIDIEGDLMIDHADCKLPMLGTSYKIRQDSVHLSPGKITLNALLTDKNATSISRPFLDFSFKTPHTIPHTALLKGTLDHNHFNDLKYRFEVKANNFLGYDFKEFGENSFYATCFASGDIVVHGGPGQLVVDINATPEAGTTFTYNVTTPDALTEAGFITLRDGDRRDTTNHSVHFYNNDSISAKQLATNATPVVSLDDDDNDNKETNSSDMFLNFNLQITPAAKMRLLMDRKSGDNIEIAGSGRIMAKYHNKGRFNIYGTYRVQNGSYRLSIQDIIRRDFKFQPDGTIIFGGDAMKADLNLKAVYSVHGVSLDDLSTSSLGFSKTQVDCIMNLTGHPEHPIVDFDFDLPEATEDEKQMVRSIVSTEEERNIQAIYLLGLGRFYNFSAEEGFKSSTAINSLVSSTLSSQINQFISNAVGGGAWSFGTNLKTGDDGWRNMDVEGMLTGSLLNNRLLLSGNFGYREKYYTQRNFISDVSVEYLLNKSGTISLKAYNQANDRYFVQSALNTQGIGIQFKKDFNRLPDLFLWVFPRKRE